MKFWFYQGLSNMEFFGILFLGVITYKHHMNHLALCVKGGQSAGRHYAVERGRHLLRWNYMSIDRHRCQELVLKHVTVHLDESCQRSPTVFVHMYILNPPFAPQKSTDGCQELVLKHVTVHLDESCWCGLASEVLYVY